MAENLPEDAILPYDETPHENWGKAVSKWSWKIISRTSEYTSKRLEGTCPRCNHQMSYEVTEGFGFGFKTPDSSYYAIKCNCSTLHPPAEKGQGCGQSAKIRKF